MPPIVNCDENIDPLKLVRDGTHQQERLISALDPANVPVDDKSVANGLIFAKAYSEHLKYYNAANVVDGNWQPFFSSDPSVLLATCAIQDVDHYQKVVQSSSDYLNDLTNANNIVGVSEHLSWLFAYVATLSQQLDALLGSLPAEIPFRSTLENVIRTRLAPAMKRLMQCYKADLVAPQPIILAALPFADEEHDIILLGARPIPFAQLYLNGLSKTWIVGVSTDWASYTTSIDDDSNVYGDQTGVFARANHVSRHSLFTGVFDQFLMALARLVGEANAALTVTLTSYDKHEPHYALFLTFLQLLEHARTSANTLTSRHLDFYYRDILGLKERPPTPSRAHLVLEPAKHVTQHEVAAGSRFRAGKGADGKEMLYASDRTLAVNQATVASMKKFYREGDNLFVAPIANSDDGINAELKSDDKSWHPFFNKTFVDGVVASIEMTPATVGFAIASHYLLLAEGKRTITITLEVGTMSAVIDIANTTSIRCLLSGEKGWFDGTIIRFKSTSSTTLAIEIIVEGDQPAVIPVDAKLHGMTIGVSVPMLKVTFTHTDTDVSRYGVLEHVVIHSATLHVEVDRVKALILSNDFGSIDSSKPFLPFGSIPETGSALVVGSQEIFTKQNLDRCDLTIKWKGNPGAITRNGFVESLIRGQWDDASRQTFFDGDNLVTISIMPARGAFNPLDSSEFEIDDRYSVFTRTGFMRLSIASGFGHSDYPKRLATEVSKAVMNKATVVIPPAPYTPTAESLYASYSATQTIDCSGVLDTDFTARQARIFHVTDFGFAEQHAYLKAGTADTTIYLLPQLAEGEFYIGLKGLVPPQTVSMLFQTVVGTENPLILKPENHIEWSYLRNNEWLSFADNDIADGSRELLASGIISVAIPRDATSTNTLLQSDMVWLRLAVREKADAVCRLVLVATQAVDVTLANVDSATSVVTLPAGSISKLERPHVSIKKISQPLATFGGKVAEVPAAFYTRVSELLRHKNRAVTLWDYEHLILEEFPQIHRVKCLNHTQYEPNGAGSGVYRELAPGHVTIVTIPDQQGPNFSHSLKPYTSLGLLEEIKEFLLARSSCFATLHVQNPQFEEVRVEFSVRLHDGFDETYYTNLLRVFVTQFLSPWAFTDSAQPSFGGRIYQSAIIDAVEEQAYVDYITDFQVFHQIGNTAATVSKQFVEGSRAVSLLVSAPSTSHKITVIDAVEAAALTEDCDCNS